MVTEPTYRRETAAYRFVSDAKWVHIHDKKAGTVKTYPIEDMAPGKAPDLEMSVFETLWSRAEAPTHSVIKVISGGQTGADRGGLDAAIDLGIAHGGWCPKGRKSEDGPIPDRYQLEETPSPSYVVRTKKNASGSDASLVFVDGGMSGGTLMTVEHLREIRKPHLVLSLENFPGDTAQLLIAGRVRNWLVAGRFKTLNIAGPRETKCPGIQERVRVFLRDVLG